MHRALLLIVSAVLAAQSRLPTAQQDLQTVIETTQALDPAFAADLKLQIAVSNLLSRSQRATLIEEAFEASQLVSEPLPMSLGVVTRPAESIFDTQAAAYRLGLDRLSLQTRAVNAKLTNDPKGAMTTWGRVQMPELPRAACGDALVVDLFDYYDTTLRAARGDAVTTVLESTIASMRHAAQIAPIARLLANVEIHSVDYSLLVLRFGIALDQIQASDRDFVSSVVGRADLFVQVLAVANRMDAGGQSSLPLLASTRRYLLRHLNGHRCGESEVMPVQSGAALIKRFNDVFVSKFRRGTPFQRIEYSELASSDTEPGVNYFPFWTSPTSRRLHNVTFARNKPGEYLTLWYKWQATEEASEADFFHQKCLTMFDAIQASAPGPERESLISSYLQFLATSYSSHEKREWFLHFERLANQIYSEKNSDRLAWRTRLIGTGDPLMASYGQLLYRTGALQRN